MVGGERRAENHRSLRDEIRDREQPWREEKAGSLFKVTRQWEAGTDVAGWRGASEQF